MEVTKTQSRILDIVYISMFASIIAVSSWVTIPSTIPFTLQTFGVFLALGMLGGKRGTASVVVYIMLGLVGVPVFSNFQGGFGVLAGPTGGYIIGFLFSAISYWLITKFFGNKLLTVICAMVAGLILCYVFGTVWFIILYSATKGSVDIFTALSWCVIPFIIPDAIKIGLAITLSKLLRKRSAFRLY